MKTDKVFLGVLGGVAVGALLGILFAPAKGTKTRKRILDQGNNYAGELKGKFEELMNGATSKFDKVKDKIADFAVNNDI